MQQKSSQRSRPFAAPDELVHGKYNLENISPCVQTRYEGVLWPISLIGYCQEMLLSDWLLQGALRFAGFLT